MIITVKLFALAGLALVVVLLIGIFLDIKDFDKTKGGYEPPYIGVTGEPVDWDSMDLTSTGLVKRGHVINVLVDGTTGMISFEIFKRKIDWRIFSDRALVVHKPRDAFIRLGFKPQF
ncbi:MAG: hypothetical protein HKN85_08465 [Gammaproteobacteria bacterium]|nr:hypothetical protein [Gammaproteobacteria bacterium]